MTAPLHVYFANLEVADVQLFSSDDPPCYIKVASNNEKVPDDTMPCQSTNLDPRTIRNRRITRWDAGRADSLLAIKPSMPQRQQSVEDHDLEMNEIQSAHHALVRIPRWCASNAKDPSKADCPTRRPQRTTSETVCSTQNDPTTGSTGTSDVLLKEILKSIQEIERKSV